MRRITVYGVGVILGVYALIHALGAVQLVCDSVSCQALQSPMLWWAGVVYAVSLLLAYHFCRGVLGGLVVVGVAMECALVLTQVLLNLYCAACLGYTVLFLAWVFLAGPEIVPWAWGVSLGFGLVGLVVAAVVPMVDAGCTCVVESYGEVRQSEDVVHVLFEPNCPHCHSLLAMLDEAGARQRVRLCPQAWSLTSLWKLLRQECGSSSGIERKLRCAESTLAIVRANNGFCSDMGILSAPLIVHLDKVLVGQEGSSYLLSLLNMEPMGVNGTCRINECSDDAS